MKSLIIIFLTFVQPVFGQYTDFKNREHYLHQDGVNYRFHYIDDEINVERFNNDKVYFWYQSQKIKCTQGGASGKLLTGEMYVSYPSKQLKEFGSFRRGLKDGTWKYWNKFGKLERIEKWKRGVLKEKQFFTQGEISKIYRFNTAKTIVISDSTKQIIKVNKNRWVSRSENGQRVEVVRSKQGKLHGFQYCKEGSKKYQFFWNGNRLFTKKENAKE